MNKRNENKNSMYLSVKKVLNDNSIIWAAIIGIASVVALFIALLGLIQATDNKGTKKTKGITTSKHNKKVELIDMLLAVTGAIQSFANDIGDADLFELVNFTESDFENMSDSILLNKAVMIIEVATLHAADIDPKGITAVKLVELQTVTTQYENLVPAPRNATSDKKSAKTFLKTLFKRVDDLLVHNLDKLMMQFKNSHPEFFEAYFNNRKIIDLGMHHTRLGGTITDADGNPLSEVTIKAVEADLKTETDIEGVYLFKPFIAGIFTIIFEKTGYLSITQTLVEVGLGKNVVLDLKMVAIGTSNISGVIRNNTMMPVGGATVELVGTAFVIVSLATGIYKLSNVPAGSYTMRVTAMGYPVKEVTIDVVGGSDMNFDVTL